jgi:hypothetical protein
MVMDTLALAVSASANYLLRHQEARRMMLPLVAFPICAVGDLYCIYRELKAVQLRTLNRERGEMIAERWLQCQQVGRRRRRIRRHGRGGGGAGVRPASSHGWWPELWCRGCQMERHPAATACQPQPRLRYPPGARSGSDSSRVALHTQEHPCGCMSCVQHTWTLPIAMFHVGVVAATLQKPAYRAN